VYLFPLFFLYFLLFEAAIYANKDVYIWGRLRWTQGTKDDSPGPHKRNGQFRTDMHMHSALLQLFEQCRHVQSSRPLDATRSTQQGRRTAATMPAVAAIMLLFFGFYFSTNVTAVLQRVTYTKGRSIEAVSEWYVRAQSVVLDRG